MNIKTMKSLLLVALTMGSLTANAQHEEGETTIQPRIGITVSTLTNIDNSKSKVNVAYGIEFEHYITDQFSVAGGVLFTDLGVKIDNGDDYKMNIYNTTFPITANYYILPGLALKAGLQPAFRIKAQMKQGSTKIDFDRFVEYFFNDNDFKMNKLDLSIPLGLSYEYQRFVLDARYNLGVTKLFSGLDENVFYRWLAVSLGYKF